MRRLTTIVLLLALIALASCGGTKRKPTPLPPPPPPPPKATIEVVPASDPFIVQPGWQAEFRAEVTGVSDLSGLQWSVTGGEVVSDDGITLVWRTPNVPDGTKLTITASIGGESASYTVEVKTILPPPWRDDIALWVGDATTESNVIMPGAEVQFGYTSVEQLFSPSWRANVGSFDSDTYTAPPVLEATEVIVTLMNYNIPAASKVFLLNKEELSFDLMEEPIRVPVYPEEWEGLYQGIYLPNSGEFFTSSSVSVVYRYMPSLENWDPEKLDAVINTGNLLYPTNWHITFSLTPEQYRNSLPATVDLVVGRYASKDDVEAGNVLWKERRQMIFSAEPWPDAFGS